MPNYFFECPKEHLFEAIVSCEEMLKGIPCRSKRCKRIAKRAFLSSSKAQMARRFAPALFFINEKGDVIAPGRNNKEHLPKSYLKKIQKRGYKEVNIETLRQYEEFQHDLNQRLRHRADIYNQAEQQAYDAALAEEIDSLKRGGMVEFPTEDGGSRQVKIPPLSEMHPAARRFAEYAIEQAKQMRFNTRDPNPFINAFENDNVSYRDRDTDWKKRY